MPQVKYTKPNVYTVNGVRLIPGINTVEDDLMEAFLGHPHVKQDIKDGVIILMDKAKSEEGSDTDDFFAMRAKDAVKLMPELFDIPLLRQLAEDTSRATVQRAAQAQLDKIDEDTKRDENDDENEE